MELNGNETAFIVPKTEMRVEGGHCLCLWASHEAGYHPGTRCWGSVSLSFVQCKSMGESQTSYFDLVGT